jgi:hypothetical protein
MFNILELFVACFYEWNYLWYHLPNLGGVCHLQETFTFTSECLKEFDCHFLIGEFYAFLAFTLVTIVHVYHFVQRFWLNASMVEISHLDDKIWKCYVHQSTCWNMYNTKMMWFVKKKWH